MKKDFLSEDGVHKDFLFEDVFPEESIMPQAEDISLKKNDTFCNHEDIIFDESDVFEKDDNAPDCYELSALFFVYKFLFRDELY